MQAENLKAINFEYIPSAGEARFTVGKTLLKRNGQQGLMMDLNPFGSPELAPLTQLQLKRDPLRLLFEVNVNGARTPFEVKANYTCDELMLPHIDEAYRSGVRFGAGDDQISMEFEGGTLSRMTLTKNGAGSDERLYVFREENKLYCLRKNPKRWVLVSRLSFEEGFFQLQTEEGDESHRAQLCPFVSEVVADLLNTMA